MQGYLASRGILVVMHQCGANRVISLGYRGITTNRCLMKGNGDERAIELWNILLNRQEKSFISFGFILVM